MRLEKLTFRAPLGHRFTSLTHTIVTTAHSEGQEEPIRLARAMTRLRWRARVAARGRSIGDTGCVLGLEHLSVVAPLGYRISTLADAVVPAANTKGQKKSVG